MMVGVDNRDRNRTSNQIGPGSGSALLSCFVGIVFHLHGVGGGVDRDFG